MAKRMYFQKQKNGFLMTEYEVKKNAMDRSSLRKLFLAKHEILECEGFGKCEIGSLGYINPYFDIGRRDIQRKSTRKDLMQLGYVW